MCNPHPWCQVGTQPLHVGPAPCCGAVSSAFMKVATWNVNGIRAREQQFLAWVAQERPDVLCLQEIKAHRDQLSEELCALPGYWCLWHGEGPYSGVCLG